jgi:3-phosphoglycerate kinase
MYKYIFFLIITLCGASAPSLNGMMQTPAKNNAQVKDRQWLLNCSQAEFDAENEKACKETDDAMTDDAMAALKGTEAILLQNLKIDKQDHDRMSQKMAQLKKMLMSISIKIYGQTEKN